MDEGGCMNYLWANERQEGCRGRLIAPIGDDERVLLGPFPGPINRRWAQ